ncbi:MAG: hypothetical protein J6V82_04455 [Clostridia bacterium]|nr:hypothetical protein [Clostridia bacterium]MBO7150983.1 hypothetical protein [Clostridia bacterium]
MVFFCAYLCFGTAIFSANISKCYATIVLALGAPHDLDRIGGVARVYGI